jgi:CRP-like cAMP-binding protein
VFAIESGTVEVSANGRRLAMLGAGEVFGEVAVFGGRHPHGHGRRHLARTPDRAAQAGRVERRSPETAERLRRLIKQRLDLGRDQA